MTFQKYKVRDDAYSNLSGSIGASDTTIVLEVGGGSQFDFPSILTLVQYATTNDPTSGVVKKEKILVTNISGDTLTVTRGYDGSTATTFSNGDFIYLNVVSLIVEDIQDEVSRLETDKANDDEVVKLTGAQSIAGVKTFTSKPKLSTYVAPTLNEELAPKKYVDETIGFIGDGSDGAVTATNVILTGSAYSYIRKQYTSFAPGANVVTVSPVGCIAHIQVQGDCDLTDTIFDFDEKGGVGGVGGTTSSLAVGTNGTSPLTNLAGTSLVTGGQGGQGLTGGTGGVRIMSNSIDSMIRSGQLIISGGSGGGGGAKGQDSGVPSASGNGGNGGGGGGCLILEVGGNLIFNNTKVYCNGYPGQNGTNGSAGGGGGGGAGGGGGMFLCVYYRTKTGSPTVTTNGGNGGSGGTGITWNGGAGGGGGASFLNHGVEGTNSSGIGAGSAGGVGGAGTYIITHR